MTRSTCGGFTLLEAVVSLAVLAIVLGTLTAAMGLAARSLPTPDDPAHQQLALGSVADRLRTDLATALRITHRDADRIRLLIPDRNGDAVPEIVDYTLTGDPSAGTAVLDRTENGVSHQTTTHLNRFETVWTDATATLNARAGSYEGPEFTLALNASGPVSADPLDKDKRISRRLPAPTAGVLTGGDLADLLEWSVVRATFRVRRVEVPSRLRVGVHAAVPTGAGADASEIAGTTLFGTDLVFTLTQTTAAFADATLAPAADAALVLTAIEGDLDLGLAGSAAPDADFGRGKAGDPDKWTAEPGTDLQIEAIARGRFRGVRRAFSRGRAHALRLGMGTQTATASADADDTIDLLNLPRVGTRFWSLRLDASGYDPTLPDLDADGLADWAAYAPGGVGMVTLQPLWPDGGGGSGGGWDGRGAITTRPAHPFTSPTTVRFRLARPDTGLDGPIIEAVVDSATTAAAVIRVRSSRTAYGTELRFEHDDAAGDPVNDLTIGGLEADDHEVLLLVDPETDSWSAWLDGRHAGDWLYERADRSLTGNGNAGAIRVLPGDSGGIDWLEADVGGSVVTP